MKLLFKYWYVILIVPVLVFFGLRAYKEIKTNDSSKDSLAALTLSGLNIAITQRETYKNYALNIAHHLGTAYSWFNYKRWGENDKECFDIVKKLTQAEFKVVSALYTDVYAKGNDLSEDLRKLLDSKYYEQLIVK